MKLSESTIEERLLNWPVARLATTNASGQPHVVPIVFAWQSKMLWSAIDGKAKTGATLTRIKNVKVNPAASILLDDYDNDWSQLWWLRIDVTIQVVELDHCSEELRTSAQTAIDVLTKKYTQYQKVPVITDHPVLLAMTPVSITSWQAS